jgi:short subunit dehydrogenase-like uncharacterized protein
MSEREYEIVLFGATGFTGRLTAEYLADNAPQETRWAVAGRDRAKLEALRASLAERNPAHQELPLLMADVSDPGSMTALARSTMVVITTVGPYTAHGEPLVAACAAAGTDYVDLAGEPEFVDRMWLSYNDQAVRSGARLVHSCGFDSIPYDLGALFTVMALPGDVPIELEGFGLVVGSFSGGTYQSAIEAMARLRQARALSRERRAREGRPAGRRVHGRVGSPHNEPRVGGWVVPAPTIDPQHVLRSVGGAATLAQLTPTREMLRKLKAPGDGPSAEQRARSHFRVLFVARAAGRRLSVEVSGGDPGYGETSKMLAESALCLAFDELPERSGQLTTAVAMGESLIGRLQRAGIAFRVIEEG